MKTKGEKYRCIIYENTPLSYCPSCGATLEFRGDDEESNAIKRVNYCGSCDVYVIEYMHYRIYSKYFYCLNEYLVDEIQKNREVETITDYVPIKKLAHPAIKNKRKGGKKRKKNKTRRYDPPGSIGNPFGGGSVSPR